MSCSTDAAYQICKVTVRPALESTALEFDQGSVVNPKITTLTGDEAQNVSD